MGATGTEDLLDGGSSAPDLRGAMHPGATEVDDSPEPDIQAYAMEQVCAAWGETPDPNHWSWQQQQINTLWLGHKQLDVAAHKALESLQFHQTCHGSTADILVALGHEIDELRPKIDIVLERTDDWQGHIDQCHAEMKKYLRWKRWIGAAFVVTYVIGVAAIVYIQATH